MTYYDQRPPNEEFDVVVVGSGGSGLTAADMAAETGARVLVLEKRSKPGGTTLKSGGGVWVPDHQPFASY